MVIGTGDKVLNSVTSVSQIPSGEVRQIRDAYKRKYNRQPNDDEIIALRNRRASGVR